MAEPSTFDGRALPADRAVLVIGAGTMGCGIAEVAASGVQAAQPLGARHG